jgi:hypothetical protein
MHFYQNALLAAKNATQINGFRRRFQPAHKCLRYCRSVQGYRDLAKFSRQMHAGEALLVYDPYTRT